MRPVTLVSVRIIPRLKGFVDPKHRAVFRVFRSGVLCCRQMAPTTPCPGSQAHLKDSKSDSVFLGLWTEIRFTFQRMTLFFFLTSQFRASRWGKGQPLPLASASRCLRAMGHTPALRL